MTDGPKSVIRKTILPGSFTHGLPPAPTHGPTGSKVARADVVIDCPVSVYRCDPPRRPDRLVTIVDDDGDVIEYRDATAEEFARATARYEVATAEWIRTGGTVRVPGPVVISVVVECEDGSTAKGEFAGEVTTLASDVLPGEWRWLSSQGQ